MAQDHDLLDGLDLDIPEGSTEGQQGSGGQFFGPYQLIQEVGAGGVARVMRARHIHPHYADKTFAVKVLHPELSLDPKVVSLFRREAFVLAMLKHDNVVETFEAGAQEDKLFIAMEYIDGRDLDNMISRCQAAKVPLPLPIQMHIFAEVLRGLTYAHELCDADGNRLNLIHRDVNPANVFVSFDGRVKLGDFGVASITAGRVEKSREIAGKVGYFAPEQLAGDPVDHRADLFAMGVMMFEMLCGVRLFDSEDQNQALRLNKRAKIPKPSKLNPAISAELEKVMLTALERKPQDRFASGVQMLEALQPFIPAPAGMRLGVACLMRRVFLNEHSAELQLREGLAGKAGAGAGQQIGVLTADPRAEAAFRDLLKTRGFVVETCRDAAGLAQVLTRVTPEALIVDVSAKKPVAQEVLAALKRVAKRVPVVAVADALEVEPLREAHALHAMDFLFKPYSAERVLTALRGAMTSEAPGSGEELAHRPTQKTRILLVSKDVSLTMRLPQAMAPSGYDVELATGAPEALERANHASYHAVLYDAFPGSAADRLFAQQFRSIAGNGMVPMVYLAEEPARVIFDGMMLDRSRILGRRTPVAELVATLAFLRDDVRTGRTFLRYQTEFPAEIRYGGRVFASQAVDLSRGGVMMLCEHIPPIGTEAGVILRFPPPLQPASLVGRVVRVNLVRSEQRETAQVGVEFDSFAGRSETDLITFIAKLDEQRTGPSQGLPGGFPMARP